jgi:hypothetical protein
VEALRSIYDFDAAESDVLAWLSMDADGKWRLCGNRWYRDGSTSAYNRSEAFLWTDEGRLTLQPITEYITGRAACVSVFADSGRVFLRGRDDYSPAVWEDGVATKLPYDQAFPGSAPLYQRATDVYAVGYVTKSDIGERGRAKAMLWKNGALLRLLEGTGCDTVVASSVRAIDGDTYAVGHEDGYVGGVRVSQWLLRKNDEPQAVVGRNFINPGILLIPSCVQSGVYEFSVVSFQLSEGPRFHMVFGGAAIFF